MKRNWTLIAGLVAGLSILAATAVPAVAGGIDYGAVVKHRVPTAVPVPAPAPIPEEVSNWYVRADAAFSFSDTEKYNAEAPFDDDTVRVDQGLDQFGRYSLGVGYHFSRWLRGDLTVGLRSEVNSRASGVVAQANGTGQLRDSYSDQFRSKNWVGLANAYIDMPAWSTFTPYVGAGIGFVAHTSDGRQLTRTRTCTAGTVTCTAGIVTTGTTTVGRQSELALAAAFMTGAAWKVTNSGSIDFGYRLLHLGGATYATDFTGGQARVKIPDQTIHEIRVGYRIDIN